MGVITNSMFLDTGLLFMAALSILYVYLVRNFNTWLKKGVFYQKPLAGFGNFRSVMTGKEDIGSFLRNVYDEGKGHPCVGVFILDKPMLVIRDVDLIKAVLVKDFHFFADRDFKPDIRTDSLSARSLVALTGPKWRYMRTAITPTFTSGKMKNMFYLVDECGRQLVNYLHGHTDNGKLGVKDAMARFTTDVIASCAFGIQGNALKEDNNVLRRMLKKIFEFSFLKSLKMAASKFAPVLLTTFKLQIIESEVTDYVRNVVWRSLEHREKSGVARNDFLDVLMHIRNNGILDEGEQNTEKTKKKFPELELEDDDFVAQAFTFLTAGFETSSTTLSFALYELSLQPEIQKKLRDEIQLKLDMNDGKVTYDGIQEMKYLDQVVSETLRKYPVLPFLDRRCLQSYTLPGVDVTLDKDQTILIPVLGLHWDPEFYPEPERFNPDRFTAENRKTRPHYSYLPFGEGPRSCIGMRMGLLQTKVGLVYILSHFEVCPSEGTPIPLELDPKSFLLSAKGELPLRFQDLK